MIGITTQYAVYVTETWKHLKGMSKGFKKKEEEKCLKKKKYKRIQKRRKNMITVISSKKTCVQKCADTM